ncbi:hypothetical protein SGCOL_005995 [Colletotrichum sp. CLE4]
MLSLKSTLALCAAMISTITAVSSISDTQMTTLLNEGGIGLAMAAQPMWFFGQAMNQPPCIPTHAVFNGQQAPGAELCGWPDAGCYDRKNWGDIQNTFNTVDASLPRGGDNSRKNLDHPKVYVAWSKHAIYHDRNTGWNDVLSQLTNNAFRSQDWWHYHASSKSS